MVDVVRRFETGETAVTALGGVSLDFDAGTFTAIMGPSGSGKSTLLHCAAGIDRVDAGEVWFADLNLARLSRTKLAELRRDRTGFVFQAYNLIPTLTAQQNVELPVRLAGQVPDPVEVADALARVGLADHAGRLATQLSGGQQQRVAIARALFSRPQVLFADEPTGALDIRTSRQVLTLLSATVSQAGMAVIMVTHDPVAAAQAERVVFLADGRVVDEMVAPTAEKVSARMTTLEDDVDARQ
ncbi:MAG: ABC transporter ATP-binding protein [Nocardioides sp.]|uniref:ABC transporter ATP-binding protein n=1 Tax=Nocardioides sp. TaxID=35761 RepID=UPI0039E6B763